MVCWRQRSLCNKGVFGMHRWLWVWMAAPLGMGSLVRGASGDWPQWRGPDRTGVVTGEGLLQSWPEGGPRLLWTSREAGRGYSTPVQVGDRLYLLGTLEGETESLIALDARDGRRVWATPFGRMQGGHPGPRSTPTWADGRLFVLSSDGKLLCAEAPSGARVWMRDLVAEFDGRCGSWAYAESPLVDGDRVICTPGGTNATIVALDRANGRTLWTCAVRRARETETGARRSRRPYGTAGYASVVAAEIGGVRQYVQFLDGGVVGVAAEDGRLLWAWDAPASPVANCMTPIVAGDVVFAASAYNTGGGAARIVRRADNFEVRPMWFLREFQNHHGGVVLVDGHLYGTGASQLFCVELATGRIAWSAPSVGKGSIAAAGRRLYVRSENGPVALVEANPVAYIERGRFEQPDRSEEKAWPHPVIAGGRLYLRDQSLVLCYDLRLAP
ncbi:MAG: PQQ-like beta-propeller repeat protein [Kiritimatiellae bacterium]|nr:PQQ-like beta-propeller repeat protein [Kiritimatiellia bacterium]